MRPTGSPRRFDSPMGGFSRESPRIAAINPAELGGNPGGDIVLACTGNGTVDGARNTLGILVCSSFQQPPLPRSPARRGGAEIFPKTPLAAGASGMTSGERGLRGSWWPAVETHQPDLILISAGFDAHRDDPLAPHQSL
ncbi:MAG: hypothetical protein CM15mP103_11250 [Gammaproteobacteria bacterium]|nr:MAG: hypothetical protein CM15mP103_11250 [Gammaproteobacteria bacterium]